MLNLSLCSPEVRVAGPGGPLRRVHPRPQDGRLHRRDEGQPLRVARQEEVHLQGRPRRRVRQQKLRLLRPDQGALVRAELWNICVTFRLSVVALNVTEIFKMRIKMSLAHPVVAELTMYPISKFSYSDRTLCLKHLVGPCLHVQISLMLPPRVERSPRYRVTRNPYPVFPLRRSFWPASTLTWAR